MVQIFDTVMIDVLGKLHETEAKNLVFSRDGSGDSLLSCSVESGSLEMLKPVMIDVLGKLHEVEVKNVVSSRDYGGDSLLSCAVKSGSVEVFKTVVIDVLGKLHEIEVNNIIFLQTVVTIRCSLVRLRAGAWKCSRR